MPVTDLYFLLGEKYILATHARHYKNSAGDVRNQNPNKMPSTKFLNFSFKDEEPSLTLQENSIGYNHFRGTSRFHYVMKHVVFSLQSKRCCRF